MFFKFFSFVLCLNLINCLYQTGQIYHYDYETFSQMSTPKGLDYLIPSVKAQVLLQPIEESLIKITLYDFKSENVYDSNAINSAYFVDFKSGLIYYDTINESTGSILFKRALTDLFNLNQTETNFIGVCSLKSEQLDETTFRKLKFNCTKSHLASNEFRRNEKILNSLVDRNIEFVFKLTSDNLIQQVTVNDTLKIFSEFNSKSAHTVKSNQILQLVKTTKSNENKEQILLKNFKSQSLNSNIDINELSLKLANIKSNLKQNEKNLEQLVKLFDKKTKSGTSETCRNFLSIVKNLRKDHEINSAQKQLNNLLSKEKIAKILIEAYLSSQTKSAIQSVTKSLDLKNSNEKHTKLIQSLLVSSSLLSKLTTNDLFQTVETIIKNSNKFSLLKSQAYLTLGSLVNLASQSDIKFKSKLDLLLNESEKPIKDYQLKLIYLESLKNTKLANDYIGVTNFKNSAKLLLSTLKYIDSLNDENLITNDLLRDLLLLFDDSNVKEEIRLEALNLILDKYEHNITCSDSPILENILIKLFKKSEKKTTKEFKFFSQQLIWNKMKSNSILENKVLKLFSKKSLGVNLFDFMSLNGTSVVMSSFANETSNSGIGFKIRQLMSDDGFMRSVDLSVNYIDINRNLVDFLKLEIYANNLNALTQSGLSGSSGDPSISIHLSVMGKKLNIAQIFKGYTEMLGLIWKLPTKMTSLFDVNFLLSDQNENLILQNGLVLNLETLGAISFDMSGKTDISIWSQSADLNFKKSTAVRIEQKLTIFNDLNIFTESQFNFDTQMIVDLSSFIDFSSTPSKVCVQISNRKFHLRETSKLTSFKLNKIDLVRNVSKRTPVQPVSWMISKQAVSNC